MNPLEIVLIIIGIIVIIISCLLVDKSGKREGQSQGQLLSLESSFSEEDKKKVTDKINEILSDISEEAVIRTDDTLSKLSNEKIMAVNEFSEQILEKMKRNHEEVVFLYNMLNDKEKELKAVIKEIDSSKKKVQEILEAKSGVEKSQAVLGVRNQTSDNGVSQTSGTDKTVVTMNHHEEAVQEELDLYGISSNNNSQILELYSQGRSVIEISKLLGLGQGEVKLVIDLYKGKK